MLYSHGDPYKVGLVVSDPYANPSFGMADESKSMFKNTLHRGFELEVFNNIFAELLNLRLTYTSVANMTVLYDMLASGQLDIVASTDIDNNFTSNIGITKAVTQDSLIIVYKSRMSYQNVNIFSIMTPHFWIMLSCVGIVVTAFRAASKKYCNQQNIPASVPWYFIVGVILGLVSNLLTAYLVVPASKLAPFNNMDEFASQIGSDECKLIVRTDHLLLPLAISGNASWNAVIRSMSKLDRIQYYTDRNLLASVIEGSNEDACIYWLDFALRGFYLGQFCTLDVYDIPNSNGILLGFPFNKLTLGSRLTSIIDVILTEPSVQSLYQKMESIYFKQLPRPDCRQNRGNNNSMTFNLLDLFAVMGLGIAIAITALILELISHQLFIR